MADGGDSAIGVDKNFDQEQGNLGLARLLERGQLVVVRERGPWRAQPCSAAWRLVPVELRARVEPCVARDMPVYLLADLMIAPLRTLTICNDYRHLRTAVG